MATATMSTLTTAVPAGVSGTVRFFQNPFIASDNSQFTVEIVGMPVNTKYWVCMLPTNTANSAAGFGAGDADEEKRPHVKSLIFLFDFPSFLFGNHLVIIISRK